MSSRAVFVLALALLASCRSSSQGPVQRIDPNANAPEELREHKRVDPGTGQTTKQWATIAQGNRPGSKQGKEIVTRADGTKEWEREWDHGKPSGVWRSWYENGQMRSECFFAGPKQERVMTFWFANGQRRLQGPAKDGVRCGHWRVWYENGQLAEEGEFVGSRREGAWQAWSKDGQHAFVRTYKHDVRIEEREGLLTPAGKPAPAVPDAVAPPSKPDANAAGATAPAAAPAPKSPSE